MTRGVVVFLRVPERVAPLIGGALGRCTPGMAAASAVGPDLADSRKRRMKHDAIDMLKGQHHELRALFRKIKRLEQCRMKEVLFVEIADMLALHTAMSRNISLLLFVPGRTTSD